MLENRPPAYSMIRRLSQLEPLLCYRHLIYHIFFVSLCAAITDSSARSLQA